MLCHAQRSLTRHDHWGREPSEGTSSTGRASVSKTEGWGFKSLVPCRSRQQIRQRQHITTRRTKVRGVTDSKAVRGPRDNSRDKSPEGRTSIPTFYRQVVAELRKVVWPTQEQLVTYFTVVMVFVLVMMAIVSGPGPRVRQAGLRGLHRPFVRVTTGPDVPDPRATSDGANACLSSTSRTVRSRSTPSTRRPTALPPSPETAEPTAEGVAEDALVESVLEDVVEDEPSEDELFAGGEADSSDEAADEERRAPRRMPTSPPRTTRSRRSAPSCGPSPATGSWCTPTPAWRTG